MNIRKKFTGVFLALLALSTVSIFAQNTTKAQKMYDAWHTKQASAGAKASEQEILVAASAIKTENVGVTVDFVIGVGPGVTKLGELEFVVKPLAVKKEKDGKYTLEELPGGGTLKTNLSDGNGEFERAENGVISTPQMTIKLPAGAGAIRITVKETSAKKGTGVILALLDTGSSAVMSGVVDQNELFAKCQWHQAVCPCGTLCSGCNGSVVVDCMNCTIFCENNDPCTPGGPVPPNCS